MVFWVIAVIYFVGYFHRTCMSVIAPEFLSVFQTTATALGLMSSMFFTAYGIEQPLVGHLADRWGPKTVVGAWSLVAAAGCLLFGLAPTIAWAAAGRGLIGLGVGGVYVPTVKAFSQWFGKTEFATIMGLYQAIGNLGGVVATAPFAWVVAGFGWRIGLLAAGGLTLFLSLLMLLRVKDHPGGRTPLPQGGEGQAITPGVIPILASSNFWIIAMVFFVVFGTYITFQGLWATPFLISALDVEYMRASELTMLIPIGYTVGAPLSGWLVDRFALPKVQVLLVLLTLETLLWCGLAAGGGVGVGLMTALLVLLGGVSAGIAINVWTLVREIYAETSLGLASGLLNVSPLLGVAVLQPLTGIILDSVGRVQDGYPPEAYREAFSVCSLLVAACLAIAFLLRRRMIGKNPPEMVR
jgi:MFS family permease